MSAQEQPGAGRTIGFTALPKQMLEPNGFTTFSNTMLLEPLVVSLTSLAGAEASFSADAAVFVPIARPERVLAARRSRERTPPPRISSTFSSALACSSTAHGADHLDLAAGSTVIFTGLVSRADLVGKAGTVASFDEASSRFAIIVVDTGESVRVLAKNLRPSS